MNAASWSQSLPVFIARVGRDPFVHFVALASLLFVVHRGATSQQEDARVIVIPSSLRADLARQIESTTSRQPTTRELEDALTRWKTEEVMFQEALRLGLDDNDSTIRKHLIAEAKKAYRDREPEPEPSDQELADWLEAHRTSYLTPERYDFEQAITESVLQGDTARARAEALSARAARGEDIDTTRFEQQTFKQVARRFTPKVATRIIRSEGWQAIDSPEGWQVVRLTGRHGGEVPPINEIRGRLVRDWQVANQGKNGDRALERAAKDAYVFIDEDASRPAG